MNCLRFNLSQLLALMVFVGSNIAFFAVYDSDKIIWRNGPLKYSTPAIPDDFADNGRPPPEISLYWGGPARFEDGRELYLDCHWSGWKSCRENFYNSYDWAIPWKNDELETKNWSTAHYYRAAGDGYQECGRQLEQLLNQHTTSELRSKLGYSKHWHSIPFIIIVFISLFAVVALRSSTKNGG